MNRVREEVVAKKKIKTLGMKVVKVKEEIKSLFMWETNC